jgi:hypothetical protein
MAAKKKARKKTVVSIASLRQRAALLLKQEKTNTEKFRRKVARAKGEFPSSGCDCTLCQAARLIRRADNLAKAA